MSALAARMRTNEAGRSDRIHFVRQRAAGKDTLLSGPGPSICCLRVFSPLRFRNFRLLWIGLVVSFTGSFMQQASILWHVSLLAPPDQKGLALGIVGLVRAFPLVLFSLVAGVAADAFDRRKLMMITQVGGTIVAGLLAALAFAGVQSLWMVYVLAGIGAAVGAFIPPARQALVATLVSREHLPNAVNLNTAMVQATSVIGPAVGGLLIARANVGWAYAVNALSFLFVVAALLMMRDLPVSDRTTAQAREQFSIGAAREGLRWVFRQPVIRSTMLLDFFATFFASAMALLPVFAQDVLHVGARGYGLLAAAPAFGAVLATVVMLPLTKRMRGPGNILDLGRPVLWAVDRGLWFLAVLCAHILLPRTCRRQRCRQRDHPQPHSSARDA